MRLGGKETFFGVVRLVCDRKMDSLGKSANFLLLQSAFAKSLARPLTAYAILAFTNCAVSASICTSCFWMLALKESESFVWKSCNGCCCALR